MMHETTYARRLAAEFIGTAFLVCAVIGSGIMAERLAAGNTAVALLANTIATGAALIALILMFGPVSGAHFNPAVSFSATITRDMSWTDAALYSVVQCGGGIVGAVVANMMFGLPAILVSTKARTGSGQWLGEFIATFGLIGVIIAVSRRQTSSLVAVAVGCYIMAGYWFTASTSFANPAVTISRVLSDTFTGIRPGDAVVFIVIQLIAALTATFLFSWLVNKTDD